MGYERFDHNDKFIVEMDRLRKEDIENDRRIEEARRRANSGYESSIQSVLDDVFTKATELKQHRQVEDYISHDKLGVPSDDTLGVPSNEKLGAASDQKSENRDSGVYGGESQEEKGVSDKTDSPDSWFDDVFRKMSARKKIDSDDSVGQTAEP